MENKRKSRREALKLIGKTGLLMGAAPVFFASLKIIPEGEPVLTDNLQRLGTTAIQEKAIISGSGSSLTVKVTGTPGRVFFVTFAGENIKENFRRLPGSDGIINARGTGSVVINIKPILNSRIFVKVITGESNNLSTRLSETEAFAVTLKEGVINTFEGVTSRPLINYDSPTNVLIAMAATTGTDKSFQLR